MAKLISIDPGLRGVGVGLFVDGQLQHGIYIKNTVRQERGPVAWAGMADAVATNPDVQAFGRADELVLEVPQVYHQRFQKGDQSDLIEVAGVAGALSSVLEADRHYGYLPRQWKGQVPKEIHNARVLSKLSGSETANIQPCAASLRHNVLDGIGLGLFHLKRN